VNKWVFPVRRLCDFEPPILKVSQAHPEPNCDLPALMKASRNALEPPRSLAIFLLRELRDLRAEATDNYRHLCERHGRPAWTPTGCAGHIGRQNDLGFCSQ